jgi:glycosyltransferase involved in cell wall biosynthesis
MRICFLADSGSVNTKTWVGHFADVLGHDVHVVSVNRRGTLAPSVTLHHLGSDGGTQGLSGKAALLRSIGRIREIVATISPDLVVGYRVASYGFLAALSGFHPLAVAAQGQYIVYPAFSLPKRVSARAAIRAADLLNSWAPHMTKRLVELGADPARILTCPRGIDLAGFRLPEMRAHAPTVVSTRSLDPYYRVDVIVRAIALARRALPDLSLTIVGAGDAAEPLKRLAVELGEAEGIRFVGHARHDELPSLLEKSAIYVSAVPSDGVSASLLEAMASGCFPIVRDNASNRYWLEDGRTGFMIPGDRPEDFAAAIAKAWDDPELRARAAEANRRVVEERGDIAKNMRTIEAAYRDLVEQFGGARQRTAGGRRGAANLRRLARSQGKGRG